MKFKELLPVLFPPPLFQDTWPRVQLLCAERNAPCQWDLAIDKAKPPMSAGEWQGNDQTDLQCQTARQLSPSGPMSYLRGLALRIWTSFWWRGFTGMDMWNAPMVQSRQTARDIQVDGKCGPRRPKVTWKQLTERDCREWKLSAIDRYDRHIWISDMRPAMYAASHLAGRGATDVDIAPVPGG